MTTSSDRHRTRSSVVPPRAARLTWLVLWEWVGDHARVDQPIAAMLPRRLGHETVQRIVEALYAEREYTPSEMLEAALDRGHNPYRAQLGSVRVSNEDGSRGSVPWHGEVICGHNPHLVARHARVWIESGEVRYKWAYGRPQLDLRRHNHSRTASLEPPE